MPLSYVRLITGSAVLALIAGTGSAAADHADSAGMRCEASTVIKSGSSGGLFERAAWAEDSTCLDIPIQDLVSAASRRGVLTWRGVTRIASENTLPLNAPFELSRIAISYEASHKYLWCHLAVWPMDWTVTVQAGSPAAPSRVAISGERVPGGNADGAYLKQLDLYAELSADGPDRTLLHVRYQVQSPFQTSTYAAHAVAEYVARLVDVARGGAGQQAIPDAACPHDAGTATAAG